MAKRLVSENAWVRGVDLRLPQYEPTACHAFVLGDLRDSAFVQQVLRIEEAGAVRPFDVIYQFAADMGGAGFVFTGRHDADILSNSASININVLQTQRRLNEETGVNATTVFFSSSACMYPQHNQQEPNAPNCKENSAYPANPDSEYGWEKLFAERLYFAFMRNHGIPVRVARYHNIFGPFGAWKGGREKAPAALCRKVLELSPAGGVVQVWGDGQQTRSFMYIDECVEATRRFVDSDFTGPVNIGSEEMVSIDRLVQMIAGIANKPVQVQHVQGPLGVRGRCSSNDLFKERVGWESHMTLEAGLRKTYDWICGELCKET
jgi:nucleoside-diphosphate-sugar epimerase